MPIEDAAQVLTSTLSLMTRLVEFAGEMINPLDEGSTFVDWILSLVVISPIAFTIFRMVVRLAAGYRLADKFRRKGRGA